MFRALDTKACPPTPSRLFPVPPGIEVGYVCTGRNQGQGTVPWFRHAFLKQYCELNGQSSGRGYVSMRRAHKRRCLRA